MSRMHSLWSRINLSIFLDPSPFALQCGKKHGWSSIFSVKQPYCSICNWASCWMEIIVRCSLDDVSVRKPKCVRKPGTNAKTCDQSENQWKWDGRRGESVPTNLKYISVLCLARAPCIHRVTEAPVQKCYHWFHHLLPAHVIYFRSPANKLSSRRGRNFDYEKFQS